jgi:hypothetical protein
MTNSVSGLKDPHQKGPRFASIFVGIIFILIDVVSLFDIDF